MRNRYIAKERLFPLLQAAKTLKAKQKTQKQQEKAIRNKVRATLKTENAKTLAGNAYSSICYYCYKLNGSIISL